jgi:hypothetical protein
VEVLILIRPLIHLFLQRIRLLLLLKFRDLFDHMVVAQMMASYKQQPARRKLSFQGS